KPSAACPYPAAIMPRTRRSPCSPNRDSLCHNALSVYAATDIASCPLEWQLYQPREWTDEPDRCRKAGVPETVVHQEKWRLALGLLDTLAEWKLKAPVVVADAGYGVSTPFRLGLQERGLSYVLALNGKEVAHPENVEPQQPAYGGLGPPTLMRYRTAPRAISALALEADVERFSEVTWRQSSKGAMTSRFTVLTVRPAGKQSLAAAQEAGGGRNRWDGVLPTQTLLVEWPDGQDTPTDYWISNLPATTPVADLVRWAKMRWRIEHDYRELKHGLGLDHFEGRTWRGWHHHVTLVTAAQAFLTLRRLDPKVQPPARASTRPSTYSKTY
ncbi:IS701 family transposase, partial [Streptomyces scabiei]|uniref:IS701 family transposase n=5 Tax=Streptomyces scabiei TaxID=1930 RepID=UPI0029A83603